MSDIKVRSSTTAKDNLHTGTTTVGIVVQDAVILGADHRATEGFFVASKTAQKIHQVNKNIAMTIAGSVADAQYLVDLMAAEAKLYELEHSRPPYVNTIVKILANELFRMRRSLPYEVQHIVGGVDAEGPKLYDVGGDGSIIKETFTSTGSGSLYAYGVLEDRYKDSMSIEEGVELVKTAVRAAISRDLFTGNGVSIFVITKDGIQQFSFPSKD
ncbi:MAG TPA: proteasome subunit beta [Candidatus Lokiarchaeia archaeon]|nr:proteasome subunit beta [Candidatus Lokiarchaeia archaeon]